MLHNHFTSLYKMYNGSARAYLSAVGRGYFGSSLPWSELSKFDRKTFQSHSSWAFYVLAYVTGVCTNQSLDTDSAGGNPL